MTFPGRRTVAETRYGFYSTLTRRGSRLLFRSLIALVLIITVFTLHDSRKPEENRLVSRDAVRAQLALRLGPKSNDPRTWPGWGGIKTIFAL